MYIFNLFSTLVNNSYDLLVERFLVFSLIVLEHFGSPLLSSSLSNQICSGFVSRPGLAAIRVGAQNTHSLAEERARFMERRPNEKPRICIPPWAGGVHKIAQFRVDFRALFQQSLPCMPWV